jgi:hypothetical protein
MRLVHHSFTPLLGALSLVGALHAQQRPISLAAGGGLLFADNGSAMLHSRGITGFVRLSWRRFPLILDASVHNVPRNRGIVFGPCPPSPAACGSDFTGPTTALTLAPAIQATQRVPVAAWLFRLGPSVSWLADRAQGSHPLAAGLRAGISVRNGQTQSGLLISVDYFRLFRSEPPAWFFPVTIGWQF